MGYQEFFPERIMSDDGDRGKLHLLMVIVNYRSCCVANNRTCVICITGHNAIASLTRACPMAL